MPVSATVTPTPTGEFSEFVINLIEDTVHIDAVFLLKAIGYWLVFVWLVFSVWVFYDAVQRYRNPLVPVFWFVFVLPFNVLGFVGYLLARPLHTVEDSRFMEKEGQLLDYELSQVVVCPSCGRAQSTDNAYCFECGAALKVKCKKCGAENPVTYTYCVSCGASLVKNEESKQARRKSSAPGVFSSLYEGMIWWGAVIYRSFVSLKNAVLSPFRLIFPARKSNPAKRLKKVVKKK